MKLNSVNELFKFSLSNIKEQLIGMAVQTISPSMNISTLAVKQFM